MNRTSEAEHVRMALLVPVIIIVPMWLQFARSERKANRMFQNSSDRSHVQKWLAKAPFDDPQALAAHPEFSYESWLEEGRGLPHVLDVLVELLKEDLARPSGNGDRIAYAIGQLGNKRAVPVLLEALKSRDLTLRSEAVAALGRLGDSGLFETLRRLLEDPEQDSNVRANACISIGRIAPAGGDGVLRKALTDPDPFVGRAAAEGLRLFERRNRPSE